MSGPARSLVLAVVSVTMGLASSETTFAQGQADPPSIRLYCVKVAPGKGAEFEAFLKDVSLPMARARADAGEFAWSIVEVGAVPAGSSARCDYQFVYGYKGLPPEAPSRDALTAALKQAKVTTTYDEMVARRNALSQLVAVELWSWIDGVGPGAEKDNFIQLNHYNVKYGEMAEWVRLETTYWKVLMDAWLKAGGKGAWAANGLLLPAGEATPYNALTVDVFPDWNSVVSRTALVELWPKVHPGTTTSEFFDRLEKVRSVHDRELYKVVYVVRAK